MEYRGIKVSIDRVRTLIEVALPDNKGRKKDVLVTEDVIKLFLWGYPVFSEAFIFEYRSIFEEFVGKRLGQYSNDTPLNCLTSVIDGIIETYLYRSESSIVLIIFDPISEETSKTTYNMIQAKTVLSILNKTIQSVTL